MTERRTYCVGDHRFAIDIPKGMMSEKELSAYAPFQTDSYFKEEPLFSLTLIEDPEDVTNHDVATISLEDENGNMTLYREDDGNLTIFITAISGQECGRVKISKDYRTAKAWTRGSDQEKRYAFDTVMMLLYTFASAKQDTLLMHASSIESEGQSYMFLGKSGTGKSTHSRLWTDNIKGAELLNDDNPVVRTLDGKAYIYGSPWSGKTPCHINKRLPLGGIVRLSQSSRNSITLLNGIRAYAAIIPSCSCMKWDHEMSEAVHSTISKVIERVPVFSLDCLPDREAVFMCRKSLQTVNLEDK